MFLIGHKSNAHEALKRRPSRLLNVSCKPSPSNASTGLLSIVLKARFKFKRLTLVIHDIKNILYLVVHFSDIVWNPIDEKVILSFCCKNNRGCKTSRNNKKLSWKMFFSCPVVLCDGDVSSNWLSTDSWSV